MVLPEISDKLTEKKPRAKSNAQKKYDLFRSVGNAVRRIREENEKKFRSLPPEIINYYVLEHVTPTRVKVANSYPKKIQIDAFKTVKQSYRDTIDLPENIKSPFQHYPNTYIIGYDIEFQEYKDELHKDFPAKLLSHQFYFNFAGHRFGVILITEVTFRAIDLVRFINTVVPENSAKWLPPGQMEPVPELTLVRIYAHFSAIESGWMHPSMQLKSEFMDFFGFNRAEFQPLIAERDKEWHNKSLLRVTKPIDPITKKPSKKDQWRVELMYCDSKNLSGGGSLEDLGNKIGIPKLKHEHIEEMENYLITNKDDFCRYGMMDSIITAETHLWYNNVGRYQLELNVEKERAAGISAELFKKIFFDRYGDDWKRYLGYSNKKMTIAHRAFVQFYHGGRNEVMSVGPKENAVYYDLRSAYPTALIMLPDYDFSCSKTYHGEDAVRAVKRLEADTSNGPFQVAGIVVSFKFRKDVPPIFPVRIDEPSNLPNAKRGYDTDGLVFPRSGHTTITWPELWVARNTPDRNGNNGLLEELTIHSLVTFQNLGTYYLSDKVYEVLAKRNKNDKSMDSFYKQILNYFYGKTGQAIAQAATSFKSHNLQKPLEISSVTCYPLASFITGFCRAAVAELLQKHDCYGITTDGFISPLPDGTITKDPGPDLNNPIRYTSEELNLGKDSFCGRVHDRVKDLNPFIGIDSQGDKSLFLKTRGYLLVTGDLLQKLARGGAQTRRVNKKSDSSEHIKAVEEFLKITQRGKCDKVSWRSLPNQRKYWRAELDELFDSDEVLSRAKQALTTTRIRVMHSDKGLIQYSKAESLYGRISAKRQLKHTKDSLPLQVTFKDAKVNITFDMKRIPKDPVLKPFYWQGKKYEYVSFETDPLNSLTDFHLLRALADRGISHSNYIRKIADTDSDDVTIGIPYKQLRELKKTNFPPISAKEKLQLKLFFPEVSEHIEQKEKIRLATDDEAIIQIAYRAYLARITEEINKRKKKAQPIDDLDSSYEAFIEFIKDEIKRKKEKTRNNAPYKPDVEKKQYNKPLTEQEFEGDYEWSNDNKIRELKEYWKKIDAACKSYKKLQIKTAKAISLDLTFERDELIEFMSRHGGGDQKTVGTRRGFVEEEPVCMELDDYKLMLREFKKVTEFGIEPTALECEMFKKVVDDIQPYSVRNELYELLVSRRRWQISQEYELEKCSEIPVGVKSTDWLQENAERIIAEYEVDAVSKYIQNSDLAGIKQLRMHVENGMTFSGALQTIECGALLTPQEIRDAGKALEKVAKTQRRF